ncbi:glycosyltransferase [uncultured Tenacibaculum sp.]|uniref:glycosyltransferase n=1 Tax=uncultured Tenacibaculum sp. TaxID=174713 RepID=UPI002639B28B|nr:glycosyltransferase [uncultured Tenacibaculum sp.]
MNNDISKSPSTFNLVIIIPCYNEENRLSIKKIEYFLSFYNDVLLVLVNDGSTDLTKKKLDALKLLFPNNIKTLHLNRNLGKAEAVRQGMLFSLNRVDFQKIAYLDADFSTSLQECYELSHYLNKDICFVFGSRIAKIDTEIKRKKLRFLIGRVVATLISQQLKLKIYDTQCGCKIFEKTLAENIFQEKFISRWLFDVEIFHRIITIKGRYNMKNVARELPLKKWIDTEDSRVKLNFFFKLGYDLITIRNKYKSI